MSVNQQKESNKKSNQIQQLISNQKNKIQVSDLMKDQVENEEEGLVNGVLVKDRQEDQVKYREEDREKDQEEDQVNDLVKDQEDDQEDDQKDDQVNNLVNDLLAKVQESDLLNDQITQMQVDENRVNVQMIRSQVDCSQSNMHSTSAQNTKLDDGSFESVHIQIDTLNERVSSFINEENDSKQRSEVNKNEKFTKSNDKQPNSAFSNGHQAKEQSEQTINSQIPGLLLTENNRPNGENKLVIVLALLFKLVTYFVIEIIGLFHPAKRNALSPINDPLLLLSAGEITERIKNGQVRCEHVIKAYINRIKSVQPALNAMVDNCFDDAIKRASEIDEQLKDPKLGEELKKLPLLGVPFTCKDSISVKGLALTAGVKIRKGMKADQDATVVSNLRSAGAIPLCLTNIPELLIWCDTENNLYGRTNNPYDTSRIVGGSSGGEGCLIAAAGSLIGVGSDVAGSIRIPAMFTGVFGHKTIMKNIPVDGMFPTPPKRYKTFLSYGPLCRYATDIPFALRAMGGSLTDELKLDEPVDFKSIKIYYMEHDGGNPLTSFVDQRILNSMHKVMKYFKDTYGTQTQLININKFKYSLAYFGTVSVEDEFKIEDHVTQTGYLNVYWELLKSFFSKSEITRPILIQILNQKSPYCDPKSASHKFFSQMLKELKPKVHDMLGDNAILMIPTWPTVAPKHHTTMLRAFDATYPCIMNALELPTTHCPFGLTKEEGLPIGFSLAAGPGYDRITIAFAKEIEKIFGGWVSPSSK